MWTNELSDPKLTIYSPGVGVFKIMYKGLRKGVFKGIKNKSKHPNRATLPPVRICESANPGAFVERKIRNSTMVLSIIS